MRNKKLVVVLAVFAVITMLVVLGSVIFSVHNVYAHCYNADDATLDSVVMDKDTNGIRRGKSIFMLDEEEIIARIEDKCSDVKVINVERKFPNRVYVNYVKIFPSMVLETQNSALALSPDCEILSAVEKSETYPALIKILTDNAPVNTASGEIFFDKNGNDYKVCKEINDVMIRMELYNESVSMFEFIDLRKVETGEVIFIKTRTGTYFELQGGAQNIAEKIRIAVSVYLSDETSYMNSGTIIVSSSGKSASYSPVDRYAQA